MTDHEILQQYANLVYALALSRTEQPSDAEAVFQEVFLTYAQKQPAFADERRAKAWFVAVTENIAKRLTDAPPEDTEPPDDTDTPAPKKLTEQTERAMTALHEFRAEEAARRTQGKTSRFFRRAAAVAAILILTVTLTPLRGYVAEAVKSWVNDIIPVHASVNEADICRMELSEARLSNEFLYLTFDEDYSGYATQSAGASGDSSGRRFPTLYAGELSDGEGNSLPFTDENMLLSDSFTDEAKGSTARNDAHQVKQYKIYLPGLKQLINSPEKQYTLTVTLTPQACGADGDVHTFEPVEFFVNLQKENIESVLSSQIYDMEYSYMVDHLRFDFQKLYVGPSESNFVAELVPLGKLNGQDLRNTAVTCIIGETADGNEERDYEAYGRYVDAYSDQKDSEKQRSAFDTPAFFNEVYFINQFDNYREYERSVFVCDSRYYMVVTCRNSGGESRYDSEHMRQAAETGKFRLFELCYFIENDVAEDGTLFHHFDYGNSYFGSDDYSCYALPNESTNIGVKYKELSPQEATLGPQKKVSRPDISAGYYEYTLPGGDYFEYNLDMDLTANDLHLHLPKLMYQYYDHSNANVSFDASLSYYTDDIFHLLVDDEYVSGKRAEVTLCLHSNYYDILQGYCIQELVFLAEKDGKTAVWDCERDCLYDDDTLSIEVSSMAGFGVPDKLTLAYIRYIAYDEEKAQAIEDDFYDESDLFTDYVCYNPDIYTPEQIRREYETRTQATQGLVFSVKS